MLVKLFKGIQPMVYFLLHIVTLSITFYYIGQMLPHFDYFNIEIWTYNIKDFMSAFIPVKVLKWPPVHIHFVVSCICKININYFHMEFQWLVIEYIHNYVNQHQTTWHYTSRIIVTYILMFQRINNWMTFQYDLSFL